MSGCAGLNREGKMRTIICLVAAMQLAMTAPVLAERWHYVGGHDSAKMYVDVDSIADFLSKSGLAKQKFPERVELVEDLPRTASGKVQKNMLRSRIAETVGREAQVKA